MLIDVLVIVKENDDMIVCDSAMQCSELRSGIRHCDSTVSDPRLQSMV